MAQQTKVVTLGRHIIVQITGFTRTDAGQFVYGTARTLNGRSERVEQAITLDDDECSSMDTIMKHHETVKIDWTLTATEIKHVFSPYDVLPLPSIEVFDATGSQFALPGADCLEDALFGYSHARVAVKTRLRLKVFWGRIAGGDDTQDRNAGRNTLRMDAIDLGVGGNGLPIPNPQIYPFTTTIPS